MVNLEDSQAASSRQERASATVIAETWQIGVHDPGTPLLLRSEAAERLNGSESTVVRPGRAGAITEIRVGKRAPPQEGSRMSSSDARTAQSAMYRHSGAGVKNALRASRVARLSAAVIACTTQDSFA